MVLKLTNKSKNFYYYLGPIFGSRIIENKTGDKFYDDDNKIWYINFIKNKPVAFVSVLNNTIKNIWGDKDEYIIETLQQIKNEIHINTSVVPIIYKDLYIKIGFKILDGVGKNFIKVGDEDK
jgi:hypothetical protein